MFFESIVIGFLTNLLTSANGHFTKVVKRTVVDVEIDLSSNAWQTTCISILPEFPVTLIFHLVNIIVGYPIRIAIEDGGAEIAHLKFIIGIDDGLDTIVLLHNFEPLENAGSKLFVSLLGRFVLDIKNGWQVAILQLDVTNEERSLFVGR